MAEQHFILWMRHVVFFHPHAHNRETQVQVNEVIPLSSWHINLGLSQILFNLVLHSLLSPSPTQYVTMLMVYLSVVLQNIDIIVLYACIFNL